MVGGGDSAVEAALALADQEGTQVTISYRRDRFSRIKPANLERIEGALESGRVNVLWSSQVLEIGEHAVHCQDADQRDRELVNDVVAIFAGGELPTAFLLSCGIQFDTKFGAP